MHNIQNHNSNILFYSDFICIFFPHQKTTDSRSFPPNNPPFTHLRLGDWRRQPWRIWEKRVMDTSIQMFSYLYGCRYHLFYWVIYGCFYLKIIGPFNSPAINSSFFPPPRCIRQILWKNGGNSGTPTCAITWDKIPTSLQENQQLVIHQKYDWLIESFNPFELQGFACIDPFFGWVFFNITFASRSWCPTQSWTPCGLPNPGLPWVLVKLSPGENRNCRKLPPAILGDLPGKMVTFSLNRLCN